MTPRTHATLALALVALAALVSGCAGPNPLVNTPGTNGVAGFWAGVWHGLICFVTFLISLFNRDVHMYEVHNNGTWYNLGFLLGASASLGGAGRSSRRRG
jgi:hypothetical protein